MSKNDESIDYRLKVNPYILVQLGRELITNNNQAFLELIKNSYDADASYCSIELDTKFREYFYLDNYSICNEGYLIDDFNAMASLKEVYEQVYDRPQKITLAKGKITVSDDGCGMDSHDIQKGWLNISSSHKRELKKQKAITQIFNRDYYGDKGLGRISTMKLGSILKIKSWKDVKSPGVDVTIDWDQAFSVNSLENFHLSFNTLDKRSFTGTTLEVIGLTELNEWTKPELKSDTEYSLSAMMFFQN